MELNADVRVGYKMFIFVNKININKRIVGIVHFFGLIEIAVFYFFQYIYILVKFIVFYR